MSQRYLILENMGIFALIVVLVNVIINRFFKNVNTVTTNKFKDSKSLIV